MTKKEIKAFHDHYKITAIARRVPKEKIVKVAKALHDGGIRLLEITFDQASPSCIEDTCDSIRMVREEMGSRMLVGAGTVLTIEQARAACEAGAAFILAPSTDPDVIKVANALGMVTFPGAMTPTEILTAYAAGADYVKVFPADTLGLSYLKAIMGPISHVPLTAVGGVDEKNLKDFLALGVKGVGVGSNIVKKSLIEKDDYAGLTRLAKAYTSQIE